MPRTGRPRSAVLDDADALAALRARGLSTRRIAAELGVGASAVSRALRAHGVEAAPPGGGPRGPASGLLRDRDALDALWTGQGLTCAQIAVLAGTGPATVARAVRQHGLPPRRGAGRPNAAAAPALADPALLSGLHHEQGLDVGEIARRLGTSPDTVERALHGHGVDVRPPARTSGRADLDPDGLRQLYQEWELSAPETARWLGTSTGAVLRALREHGIEVRPPGRRAKKPG